MTPGEGGRRPYASRLPRLISSTMRGAYSASAPPRYHVLMRRPKILAKSQTTRKSSNGRQIVYPRWVSASTISGIAFPSPLVARIARHVSAAPIQVETDWIATRCTRTLRSSAFKPLRPCGPGLLGGNNGYERSICTARPTGALFHFRHVAAAIQYGRCSNDGLLDRRHQGDGQWLGA